MSKYYQPSGKTSPLAYVLFLVACIVGIPIVAYLYAKATFLIPIPYINFFITGAFGFAVGYIIMLLAVRIGKVRSGGIALLLGFLGGLWAYYCQWGFWITNIGGPDTFFLDVLASPSGMLDIIGLIKETGYWEIKGGAVKGTFLVIIWIIEALMIILISTIIPLPEAGKPFCEVNNKWFKEKNLPPFHYLGDEMNVRSSLEAGSMDVLREVALADDIKNISHSIFTLYANETNENYLTITNKMATRNDKNEVVFNENQIVEYLEITEDLSNALNAYGANLK